MSERVMSMAAAAVFAASVLGGMARGATEPAETPGNKPSNVADSKVHPTESVPRINGARVFGVRPGNPFLFTIPATGAEPITYSAEGLPDGLTLDAGNGRILGVLKEEQRGEHLVTLHAKNAAGEASESFKIVVGDTIALTPPMGWNSWNCWATAVDQEKVLASAKAMVDKGLVKHGWTYINIDDTWQGKRGGKFNAIQPNEKFPDMKGLCDQVHAMGLKIGIYSTPWATSYAKHIGGSADNPEGTWAELDGKTRPNNKGASPFNIGKYSFAAADAKQWAAWGFDYLKYDWNPNQVPETKDMADALKASGRDIVYSLSNSMPFANIKDIAPMANCWRTTGDIRDTWWSMTGNGFSQAKWAPFGSQGHWNDPDMLVVGYVGWGPKLHESSLTHDEQYTHISLWCLLSSPLLIGCDMTRLDPFTVDLLTNDEVLAVNQDPSGHQAVPVMESEDKVTIQRPGATTRPSNHVYPQTQVWAKTLADGSQAVGLFNLGDAAGPVTVKWADLKIDGEKTVRDLWKNQDVGKATGEWTTTVPSHGVVMVKISG